PPPTPQGLRSYPPLRLPRQSTAIHSAATLHGSTQHSFIPDQTGNFHRSGIATSLALPQVWRTDGGHRTTYCCSTPTPFSTTFAHYCGMKLLAHNSKTPHGSPRSAPVRPTPDKIPASRPLSPHLRPSILAPTHPRTSSSAAVPPAANFNTPAWLHSICIRPASAAPAASF